MKKFFLIIALVFYFAGCSTGPVEVAVIKIKGSDTMLELTLLLAEEYMKKNPGVSIYVEGGGTTTGIRALSRGNVDICTASRTLKSDEVKILAEQYGSLGMSTMIAKDALSIFLNKNNPVKNLTAEQLNQIFTCGVKNWKELGGDDAPITVVTRPPNSGTYLYFKEHILGGVDYCESALIAQTTESIIEIIDENKYAVGYGGLGFGDEVFHAKVNDIEPTEENVRNDTYPIQRYLHFYTLQSPDGAVKRFIDWVLSPEGQQIIKEAGYVPLWEISF